MYIISRWSEVFQSEFVFFTVHIYKLIHDYGSDFVVIIRGNKFPLIYVKLLYKIKNTFDYTRYFIRSGCTDPINLIKKENI